MILLLICPGQNQNCNKLLPTLSKPAAFYQKTLD